MAVDASLVREVSRSFAITLRWLPKPMRDPVSLGYLLARASDTLADTAEVDVDVRLDCLDGFRNEVNRGERTWRSGLVDFLPRQVHAGERRLLERLDDCFDELAGLPETQQMMIRRVVDTITSGQRLDLERFANEGGKLEDRDALEDYCWRVAGCVGEFWTDVGFETLGEKFSSMEPAELKALGVDYGKGLQLVNILRDLPNDRKQGRCYLPVDDPDDLEVLMAESAKWRAVARPWLAGGERYASSLGSRRLRAATRLPAMLGTRTLDLLDEAKWEELQQGVKVSRSTVRSCFWRALIS